jgi:hypothetical protein
MVEQLCRDVLRFIRLVMTWTGKTIWLGLLGILGAVSRLPRVPALLASRTRCPRGHEVQLQGVWFCAGCRGNYEGHAFSPCPNCGASAGYVECEQCELAVMNRWR